LRPRPVNGNGRPDALTTETDQPRSLAEKKAITSIADMTDLEVRTQRILETF
jgi:hypothetical protein